MQRRQWGPGGWPREGYGGEPRVVSGQHVGDDEKSKVISVKYGIFLLFLRRARDLFLFIIKEFIVV